jgi:RNA polymerase sigma-70 factor (ECF subfamily)
MKTLMSAPIESAIPTRYSLLSRLQNRDDHESWKDFFDTYWRLIYSVAIRSGLTEPEAQDVVQETVITVARDIHKFKRDRALGSFKGWLRNTVHWRIADQFRKRPGGRRGAATKTAEGSGGRTPDLMEIPDPANPLEVLWQQEWEANLFKAALDRVKARVKEEHYQVFYLYVVKRWPVLKVSRVTGASLGKVYVIKHRVAALVRDEIRNLEKELF